MRSWSLVQWVSICPGQDRNMTQYFTICWELQLETAGSEGEKRDGEGERLGNRLTGNFLLLPTWWWDDMMIWDWEWDNIWWWGGSNGNILDLVGGVFEKPCTARPVPYSFPHFSSGALLLRIRVTQQVRTSWWVSACDHCMSPAVIIVENIGNNSR